MKPGLYVSTDTTHAEPVTAVTNVAATNRPTGLYPMSQLLEAASGMSQGQEILHVSIP